MQWASLDSFLVQDGFWQDKMGKPIANRDFLLALLAHGSYETYRFYYLDDEDLAQGRDQLSNLLSHDDFSRIAFTTQADFADNAGAGAIDVLHQGDFTYFAPYLMDYRARRGDGGAFAVSGITHSLDRVHLHTRLLQILMAAPREFDAIVCSSQCAVTLLTEGFGQIVQGFEDRFAASPPAPPELVHIPLGLSAEYDAAPDREVSRSQLGLPEDHLVLLSLGRFSVRRKMDLSPLLECLEHLIANDRLPKLTLILAGGGDEADIALARDLVASLNLEPHVRVEANLDFERKRKLYAAADLFVSLADNHQETFGLTVIEAMAHGLPTVVSDFNGYRELVSEGQTGFKIPTYASASEEPWQDIAGLLDPSILGFVRSQKVALDLGRLAEALVALASSADLRRAMGEAGAEASRAYRWASIIPQYEAMWAEQRDKALAARKAAEGTSAPAVPPSLLTPDFARVFGHFPTRTLGDATPVSISAYGYARAEAGFTPTIYAAFKGRLKFPVMQAIMGGMAQSPSTLGAVVEAAGSTTGVSGEQVMRNFDFLLKHGYIEIGEA